MTGDSKSAWKSKAASGACNFLQSLVGREIIVPAEKIGLDDTEEALQGSVALVSQEESNCLWCTFPGDSKWYCWHVDEVEPWLVQPWQKAVKHALSMPDKKLEQRSDKKPGKQARKSQHGPSSGRVQRPNMTVKPARTRPQPPGPEHLWKYCKRCNSWKHRPDDFSKNNRTPDGLQFYCRYCHNRMTKFNQARRLEDQHVAQKQLQLSKSPERPSHKPQPARQSPKSGASVSAALNQQQAGFDVLVSKVPRQQRTHATYRKESVTGSLSGDLPGKGTGHEWAPHTCSDPEHGAGVSGKHRKSHPHAAPKQHSAAGKQLPKPTARCASTPAELMLQANLVLEQLERVQAEAACSQQDCSNHHAASSQGHSPAHPAHETSACSKQHKDSTAKQHVGLDGTLPAGQQQDSRPAPPEPTSSSTTFAQDGMPSKPPASAKAAEASVGARQLLSADKSSGDKSSAEPISTGGDPRHVTSPFALPAQQANAPHEEPVAGACHLSNHEDMRSQGRAERPKLPASVSQSYVEMEREQSGSPVVVHDEDDRPPCSQSRHMSPHPGRQPRPDSAAASTIMHSDSHIVVDAPQGPQGTAKPGRAAGTSRATHGKSPPVEPLESKVGARLASVSLLSEGNSRKRYKASGSPGQVTQEPRDRASGSPGQVTQESRDRASGSPRQGQDHPQDKISGSSAYRSSGSHGMDSLAAAAAAMAADAAHEPRASQADDYAGAPKAQSNSKQEISRQNPSKQEASRENPSKQESSKQNPSKQDPSGEEPSKHQLSKHDCSVSKELTDRLSKPKAAQASAESAAVAASAARPSEEDAIADPLSTLSYLMKAMSPEQLQEVLQGLRESGNSIVPAEVLESMSRQLAAAMASPEAPLQQTHNPSVPASEPSAHLPNGAYFAPPSTSPSLPFPVKAPGKKSKASTAKAGTAHSTAGLSIPAAHASASALPQWGLAGKALLNNYHMTSLPLTAPAATATATASAPVTAFKSNVPSPNSNAFSWLHQQSLQQATPGSAAALGSAPALLSSLAGYGATHTHTHSRGPITAHLPVTALGRQQAAGAFPTAALGAATTLGSTQALGTANVLGSVLGSGPAHAALELSLLLTTLQSLAGSPNQAEGANAPQTTLATNCQAAMVQLRDWLSQLQHQALPIVEPSPAQQAQEDAALAAQVRSEMWSNLQGILNMLNNQGCSAHVHDMVHQIAVHFANEQSQSVAVDRRLRSSLNKEKEARRRTQQQLQGGIQVLTALQRVLGSVKMQQQQQQHHQQQQFDRLRSASLPQLRQESLGPNASPLQPTADAEREQRKAQLQQQEWQRKEAAYQAELSLAQTNNAKLHEQVSNLTETVKLQSSPRASSSPSKQLQVVQARNQSLADELSTCKSEKNWLHEQLGVSHACSQKAAEENGKLKAQIKLLQARAADEHPDQF